MSLKSTLMIISNFSLKIRSWGPLITRIKNLISKADKLFVTFWILNPTQWTFYSSAPDLVSLSYTHSKQFTLPCTLPFTSSLIISNSPPVKKKKKKMRFLCKGLDINHSWCCISIFELGLYFFIIFIIWLIIYFGFGFVWRPHPVMLRVDSWLWNQESSWQGSESVPEFKPGLGTWKSKLLHSVFTLQILLAYILFHPDPFFLWRFF